MERRGTDRISYHLNARIESGGIMYDGLIENVSDGGVEYLMTSTVDAAADFTPDKIIELSMRMPSGDTVRLTCEVKWFLKTEEGSEKLILGMKIIDPPAAYREWINEVHVSDPSDEPE